MSLWGHRLKQNKAYLGLWEQILVPPISGQTVNLGYRRSWWRETLSLKCKSSEIVQQEVYEDAGDVERVSVVRPEDHAVVCGPDGGRK